MQEDGDCVACWTDANQGDGLRAGAATAAAEESIPGLNSVSSLSTSNIDVVAAADKYSSQCSTRSEPPPSLKTT